MGTTAAGQRVLLGEGGCSGCLFSVGAHHPCLGWGRHWPYATNRGTKPVNRSAVDTLKQQIPLLDYLQAQDWQPTRHREEDRTGDQGKTQKEP